MRIAICLHGLSTGANDKGHPVSHQRAYNSLKKNVLDLQDVDIFLHTWNDDDNQIKEIKNLYSPVKSKFEKQRMFSESITKYHSTKSRWYSYKEAVNLKKQYENSEGFLYDFVLVARFDNCFCTPFVFSEYEPEHFYSAYWRDLYNPNRGDINHLGFLDYWFFSNSENMDEFSNLYDDIDNYLNEGHELSNHSLAKLHAENLKFSLQKTKHENIDFGLERCLYA